MALRDWTAIPVLKTPKGTFIYFFEKNFIPLAIKKSLHLHSENYKKNETLFTKY